MPIRFLILLILLMQLAVGPLFSQDSEKDQNQPPVEARLIVKQSKYVLPKDHHGESFRKQIVTETDSDKLPPPPRIDLVLELKNVSDQDVMIWPRGSITYPDLVVEGTKSPSG